MACGCGCPKCQKHGDMEFRAPGRDVRDTPPPLADWFTSPRMTLPREPEQESHARDTRALANWDLPPVGASSLVGPKDMFEPALSINDAYAHRLLRVRQTVPQPEWRRATGYSTISSRQVEPLDTVHYSFAALDTEGLVDEVYNR